MTTTVNETNYRRLIEDGFNSGDLSVVDDIAAEDFAEREIGAEGVGRDVLKAAIQGLREILPDLHFEIEDIAVLGDRVWSRIRATGTNTGPLFGRPATGRTVVMGFMDVSRFVDGRIVEHWGIPDNLSMLTQLGVVEMPVPAEPAPAH